MKKQNKWRYWLLSLMMMIVYCLPVTVTDLKADVVAFLSINGEVRQSESSLQPGDIFSLSVNISASKTAQSSTVFVSHADVTGAGIDSSKASFSVDYPEVEVVGSGNTDKKVTVGGLVYNGGSKEVELTVYLGEALGSTEISQSVSYTLSAKTSDEFDDMLVVEKQDNLVVKTDQTQSIEVKVTNKGKFTVNQADATLSLNSKVEGLTIKSDTSTLKSIKSKEIKKAKFTIAVDKDTKAGVYPATVSILGNSYSVNIQVDSNIVPSALEISVGDKSVFTPGTEKTATFVIKNVGDRDAKNIRLELVNTENVAIVEDSNVKRINLLSAKSSQNITMKVRISSNYKGDSVAIPIKLTYLSSTGESAEDTQYVYLYTNSQVTASEVVISNVISPTGSFGVDQNFNVKFNISAKSSAESIQISVEGDEGIVPKSQNLFFVNKMAAGESKQYSVSLAATRAAVSSSHPIKITVSYGKGETPTVINQYGSVNISNPEKDKEDNKDEDEKLKGKPKVIIGEYEINPTIVQAGEEFVLTLGFLNTNNKHTVHNLKANILPVQQDSADKAEDTGNVFTPVDGSNTIFIADLGLGEMVTKVLNMYTIPSATAKTYQITVQMAYEDEEGNEIEAIETLGIPVEQVTKIEIGDVYVDSGQVGMETAFSVTFYNRGRTNISNMMVYLEGEGFDVQENRTFIGNFEIGDSEVYEPIIIPNAAGALTGTLVVEYEDPSGKAQKIEHPFDFEVEEMMMDDMDMGMDQDMPMETQEKNHLPLYIGIGAGAVILMIIVIVVLKKRKEKKEARLLDEED